MHEDTKKHIMLVGSSATGKSFLVEKARSSTTLAMELHVAKRCTTRRERDDKLDRDENIFVSKVAFNKMLERNEFLFHWDKVYNSYSSDQYGILKNSAKARLVLYSTNNYVLLESNWKQIPEDLRERLIIIQIVANIETRIHRLLQRRPSFSSEEIAYRLGDVGSAHLATEPHIVIRNDRKTKSTAVKLFLSLLDSLG